MYKLLKLVIFILYIQYNPSIAQSYFGHFGGGGLGYPFGGGGYIPPKPIYEEIVEEPNYRGLSYGGIGGLEYGGSGLSHGYLPGIALGPVGIGIGHFPGGEIVNKNIYSQGNKNFDNGQYYKSYGNNGEELNQGGGGFSRGETAVKNAKGDSGYYNDAYGDKNLHHNGKDYHGGSHFQKEGQDSLQNTAKHGHRKGHSIKGFKKSHHSDEEARTEHFYDEKHDEGNHHAFDGQLGSFGEDGGSSFKGGHTDAKYNSGESKKQGHLNNEHVVDESHANHGKFGENKYAVEDVSHGVHKALDNDDISGYHEANKFVNHYPTYH